MRDTGNGGLAKEQADIINHCLFGSSDKHRKKGEPYRNYFAAEGDGTDVSVIVSLVESGHMAKNRRSRSDWCGGMDYYHVTAMGMRAVGVDPDRIEDRSLVPKERTAEE